MSNDSPEPLLYRAALEIQGFFEEKNWQFAFNH